jgi:hypothetical protein
MTDCFLLALACLSLKELWRRDCFLTQEQVSLIKGLFLRLFLPRKELRGPEAEEIVDHFF